jgi:hypothetical protein
MRMRSPLVEEEIRGCEGGGKLVGVAPRRWWRVDTSCRAV